MSILPSRSRVMSVITVPGDFEGDDVIMIVDATSGAGTMAIANAFVLVILVSYASPMLPVLMLSATPEYLLVSAIYFKLSAFRRCCGPCVVVVVGC